MDQIANHLNACKSQNTAAEKKSKENTEFSVFSLAFFRGLKAGSFAKLEVEAHHCLERAPSDLSFVITNRR